MKCLRKMALTMELSTKCFLYRHELKKAYKKIEKLNKKVETLDSNNEYLFNENSILKQINRKRFVQQEDKMHFLIKREKKLQTIEQMAKNKEDFRKIRKKISEEQ